MEPQSAPTSSFTGLRTSRKTHWLVHWMDHITQWIITIGGITTILAVSTVCLFLFWVVLPLFENPVVEKTAEIHPPWERPSSDLVHFSMDEFQLLGWSLFRDGTVIVFRGDNGAIIQQTPLNPESPITAASFDLGGETGVLGYADGSVQVGTFGVQTEFYNLADVPPEKQNLTPGEITDWENGVLVRIPNGQFRHHRFSSDLRAPIAIADHQPILLLDHSIRPSGMVLAAMTGGGELTLYSLAEKKNLMTGKVTYTPQKIAIPYQPPEGRGQPDYLKINGFGNQLYVIWKDGFTQRYNIQDTAKPFLAETLDLVKEPEASLTCIEFLLGKTTLITGDSQGNLRGWFPIHSTSGGLDGLKLVDAHHLPSEKQSVTAISSSQRGRVIAVGYQDGHIRIFHVTSDSFLAEADSQHAEPVQSLYITGKEDGLWAWTLNSWIHWHIELKHPEATWKAIFAPVWYEGFDKPAFVWQSSSSTDDYEPKYSLVPLIFGTVKATFYSMLFGVPIALLAAIYTSEFMNSKAKTVIKPTIELMASLPSVVLGFLAALVFAPVVEMMVPAVMLSFFILPLTFMTGAAIWQLLPYRQTLFLQRYRFLFIFFTLPIGVYASYLLGPLAESWFLNGDIMAWLDHQAGSGMAGWVYLLFPLSALVTLFFFVLWINPWLRSCSMDWSRRRHAWVEWFKFLAGIGITLGLSLITARFLTDMGFDPRGTLVATYGQRNALIVGFVMGFAIIPIIYTISEDALSSVPEHLRSASLGCGATPWQTAIYIIIPTAMSGLFSAIMIGLGRAVGETMIVLMAAGNTPVLDWNIFNGFRTLSANIAVEMPEAVRNSTHYRLLFLAALTLFVMTFILNTIAEIVRLRFRKRSYEL